MTEKQMTLKGKKAKTLVQLIHDSSNHIRRTDNWQRVRAQRIGKPVNFMYIYPEYPNKVNFHNEYYADYTNAFKGHLLRRITRNKPSELINAFMRIDYRPRRNEISIDYHTIQYYQI